MHDEATAATSGQECAPGVGDYEVAYATEPYAPAFSFPRTARPIDGVECSPDPDAANIGPGAYTLPLVDHGPAYTMGEAPKERIVPGTTSRHLHLACIVGPCWKLKTRTHRRSLFRLLYFHHLQLTQTICSGQANADAADMPGPQDYVISQVVHGPAWTMPRTDRTGGEGQGESCPAVGPGTYAVKPVDAGPAWTIQVNFLCFQSENECETKTCAAGLVQCACLNPRFCVDRCFTYSCAL